MVRNRYPWEAAMNAAIYARKSTQQDGVADESRSVTRQLDEAKKFAKAKDWHIVAEFADDGISGAEFDRRPGLQSCCALPTAARSPCLWWLSRRPSVERPSKPVTSSSGWTKRA